MKGLPERVQYCKALCVLVTAQRWPTFAVEEWGRCWRGVRIQFEAGRKGRGQILQGFEPVGSRELLEGLSRHDRMGLVILRNLPLACW